MEISFDILFHIVQLTDTTQPKVARIEKEI